MSSLSTSGKEFFTHWRKLRFRKCCKTFAGKDAHKPKCRHYRVEALHSQWEFNPQESVHRVPAFAMGSDGPMGLILAVVTTAGVRSMGRI